MAGTDDRADAPRGDRRRARSPTAKDRLRETLIAAGRKVVAAQGARQASLRRIAAEAGYSPAVIYRYFAGRDALLLAVRAVDRDEAVAAILATAASTADATERLHRLFRQVLSVRRACLDGAGAEDAVAEVIVETRSVFEAAVAACFAALPRQPMPVQLAAGSLIAAVQGALAAPPRMQALPHADYPALVDSIVAAFLASWRRQAERPAAPTPIRVPG